MRPSVTLSEQARCLALSEIYLDSDPGQARRAQDHGMNTCLKGAILDRAADYGKGRRYGTESGLGVAW
jgi:hypothetical protein